MKKMTRRNFLKTTAAGAAAVAAVSILGACGGSSSTANTGSSAAPADGGNQAADGEVVTLRYALVDADNSNYAQGAYKCAGWLRSTPMAK